MKHDYKPIPRRKACSSATLTLDISKTSFFKKHRLSLISFGVLVTACAMGATLIIQKHEKALLAERSQPPVQITLAIPHSANKI